MDTPHFNLLTRTRGTWLVLLVASCAWVVTSIWAYRLAVTTTVGDVVPLTIDQQAPQSVSEVEQNAVELVPPTTERQSAEDELLLARQQAAEEARKAAEKKAANQAQILAEQEEAEKQRLAAAQQAAEEARLATEKKQAEAARLAAEQRDADVENERIRLAELAEQQRIEEAARRANAAQEAERVAVLTAQRQSRIEAQTSATEADTLRQEAAASAQRAAAEEARRVSAAATRLANAERIRNEELSVLSGLSAGLRFESESNVVSPEVQRGLDRIFDPLFLYSDLQVSVTVASNEFFDPVDNNQLSLERARSIVTYLTRRGLEEGRFNIQAESGEGLLFGSHRVTVSVEDPIQ